MESITLGLDSHLNEKVQNWLDTLEANHDDFVVVDNEEGDFGMVRYFGTDLDGNQNVHLATKYVEGGDLEDFFYTLAGGDMVQKIMREHFNAVLQKRLESTLDPGQYGGMSAGFVKAYADAEAKMQSMGKEVTAVLHEGTDWLFPEQFVAGEIYKYQYTLFECVELKRSNGDPSWFGFRSLANPHEYLASWYKPQKHAAFALPFSTWRHEFDIHQSIIVTDTSGYVTESSTFPVAGPIGKITG